MQARARPHNREEYTRLKRELQKKARKDKQEWIGVQWQMITENLRLKNSKRVKQSTLDKRGRKSSEEV